MTGLIFILPAEDPEIAKGTKASELGFDWELVVDWELLVDCDLL